MTMQTTLIIDSNKEFQRAFSFNLQIYFDIVCSFRFGFKVGCLLSVLIFETFRKFFHTITYFDFFYYKPFTTFNQKCV